MERGKTYAEADWTEGGFELWRVGKEGVKFFSRRFGFGREDKGAELFALDNQAVISAVVREVVVEVVGVISHLATALE